MLQQFCNGSAVTLLCRCFFSSHCFVKLLLKKSSALGSGRRKLFTKNWIQLSGLRFCRHLRPQETRLHEQAHLTVAYESLYLSFHLPTTIITTISSPLAVAPASPAQSHLNTAGSLVAALAAISAADPAEEELRR
ncbi:hypothetical protein SAY86_012614 [Trapa natans]|uniref:Uncharacterized protein n=1 Tax=Trapa natans TaxID=22666 RepID=A0AAN7MD94_TRANT|nr:hypothetical protein SAY86_012614 [Trapa natans]